MTKSAFDNLLENKIGFGRYQYIVYFVIGFVYVADGSEIIALSLLLPVLKNEWHIPDGIQSLLGSILFFGIFLGSLAAGIISDKYGRRSALLYSSFAQFWIGIFSAAVNNIELFIITRGLFGFIIGFTIPLAPSIISEITPMHLRGKGLVVVNFFFTLGKIYACFVAWFTLNDLTSGNWRAMLVFCTLPTIVVWFGTWKFLDESPRYLVVVGRIEEGVNVLNKIGEKNNGKAYVCISEQEKTALQNWHRSTFNKNDIASVRALFGPSYKRITICLWIMWSSLNFIFYGMIFILPFILVSLDSSSHKGISGLAGVVITLLGELPSIIIAMFIIDDKRFGRRNSLIISFACSSIMFIVSHQISVEYFVEALSLSRFFVKMGFAMIYPLTAEVYPTSYRTAGVGFASGVGRIGASIMPWFCMISYEYDPLGPIILFSFISVIAALASYALPFDTYGRALDLDEKKRSLLHEEVSHGREEIELIRGKLNN